MTQPTTEELKHMQEAYGCKNPTYKKCCNGDIAQRVAVSPVDSLGGNERQALQIAIQTFHRYKSSSDQALAMNMIDANVHTHIHQIADDALSQIRRLVP